MTRTIILTGSPSSTSKTARLSQLVVDRLLALDVQSTVISIRDLPAEPLLHARADDPTIAAAVEALASANGVIVATPVYKAAYSGLLKTFLDLLPQFALREKVVLPLATGGTVAHVLALDYALRPVLSSLDPLHIVGGLFILDKQITVEAQGSLTLDPDISSKIDLTLDAYVNALQRAAHDWKAA
jgi:FMN reductase